MNRIAHFCKTGLVAVVLTAAVAACGSDAASRDRNSLGVQGTSCAQPGEVTKVSKQSVVCAKTNTGSLWYATMKTKGKAQACKSPGVIRKKSKIVWVCGVAKKKKIWQATQPLSALATKEAVLSTSSDAPVVADNAVLADPQIPDDKTITQVINDAATPTVAPTASTVAPTASTVAPTASTVAPTTPATVPLTCAKGGTCKVRDIGPGGGLVFYVAPTSFTCGEDLKAKCTYLEAAITNGTAPSTWTPTTTAEWGCYDTSVMTTDQRTASLEIGQGRANTKMITDRKCTGDQNSLSAASFAAAYNGGNKTDWFLPSRKELNALCLEFFNDPNSAYVGSGWWGGYQIDACRGRQSAVSGTTNGTRWSFAADYYWSSSEAYSVNHAFRQHFDTGSQYLNLKYRAGIALPVRAF